MGWNNKKYGGYAIDSQEAYDNALTGWSIMYSRGWSLLAFCGMWGNVQSESGYNPWRWQSDNVLYTTETYYIENQTGHAYGLCQWDPASKYIYGGRGYPGYGPNFANSDGWVNDGSAQLAFLDDTAVSSGQYFPNPGYNYQISYDDYKQITTDNYSFEYATRAWFHNYERGTWDDGRTAACQYWYYRLQGITPPPPPPEPGQRKVPIWLLFKMKKRNEGDYT